MSLSLTSKPTFSTWPVQRFSALPLRQQSQGLSVHSPYSPRFGEKSPYEASFLKELFDHMEPIYERVGDLGSLGFNRLWRKKAVDFLNLKPGETVCDMMSGTGEGWKYILPRIGSTGKLIALDFSSEMTRRAQVRQKKIKALNIEVREEDVTQTSLPSASVDAIYSAYGLKTLSPQTRWQFVQEIKRILKPGGRFSLVEASLPENLWFRKLYQIYLKIVFGILKLLIGKPAQKFAMFEHYLSVFQNCKALQKDFEAQNFQVRYLRMPGDAATGLVGIKT
jgi:demethylmenaquinone methyltransferase/2-methoxy-6-polyprenyl-1,4-benzoquinol methylase